jgi:hypothetical protein
MASYGWDVNESLMTGMKIAQYFQEKEDRKAKMDMYNKIYHPEMFESKDKESKPMAPTGFAQEPSKPSNYEKGTGFDGQETMMPKGAMSMTDAETGVQTSGLKPQEPVLDTSAPTGFATDTNTDYTLTSPYNTNEQTGTESPANMPYGFGAIPKSYQPDEGIVDTAPTQDVPTTEAAPEKQSSFYDKTIAEITDAETKVNEHQDQLSKVKKLTDQLRSKGFFKDADAYEEKAYEIQKNLYESTDTYYKTLGKANDLKASLADAYLANVKNGMNPDVAWNRTMMQARTWGIPGIEQYAKIKPEERDLLAKSIINESTSIKEKMKADQAAKKLEFQNDKFNRSFALKERVKNEELRIAGAKQNLAERKYDKEEVKTFLNESHKQVASLREDLKAKQARYDKVREVKYFVDETGEIMDDEAKAKELRILTDDIGSLTKLIEMEDSKIKTYGTYLEPKDIKDSKEAVKNSTTKDNTKPTNNNFVFTNKANTSIRKDYVDFMNKTTDMEKRKLAEKHAIEQGWVTRK